MTKQAIVDATIRTTPPAAVVLWEKLASMPLDKWVQAATLVYIGLQAVVLIRNEFFKRKGRTK